jgi:hypothetical protein
LCGGSIGERRRHLTRLRIPLSSRPPPLWAPRPSIPGGGVEDARGRGPITPAPTRRCRDTRYGAPPAWTGIWCRARRACGLGECAGDPDPQAALGAGVERICSRNTAYPAGVSRFPVLLAYRPVSLHRRHRTAVGRGRLLTAERAYQSGAVRRLRELGSRPARRCVGQEEIRSRFSPTVWRVRGQHGAKRSWRNCELHLVINIGIIGATRTNGGSWNARTTLDRSR